MKKMIQYSFERRNKKKDSSSVHSDAFDGVEYLKTKGTMGHHLFSIFQPMERDRSMSIVDTVSISIDHHGSKAEEYRWTRKVFPRCVAFSPRAHVAIWILGNLELWNGFYHKDENPRHRLFHHLFHILVRNGNGRV
jgi:hypothetical protein